MTFLTEAKQIISEFVSETRESLHYVKTELLRQYHLSILKEIKETYPTTYPYIDTVYNIIDRLAQDEDCPNFVEAPDESAFENEAETDAFKFVEMKQNISDDGLNEPRYPYDTEPSA